LILTRNNKETLGTRFGGEIEVANNNMVEKI
jgi:hypothetical protein